MESSSSAAVPPEWGSAQAIEAALAERSLGDREAFAALYDRYFPRVHNYVRYRCADLETADELTSQIFERVLARIGTYQSKTAPFGAWLFAIARNTLNDHLRAQRRRSWIPLDDLRHLVSRSPSPEEAVIQSETHQDLLQALEKLAERDRDLVALKFAAGMTNRQIAEMSGLSESNVAVIIYRALHRLRTWLGEPELPADKEHPQHERS